MIGLTGGIASGKSTVSKRLRELGALVFDADEVSRGIIAREDVLESIREAFGEGVFKADGSLDRAALAKAAFRSDEDAERLNGITHPAIMDEILKRASEADGSRPVFVDAALLIESGFYRYCDSIWLITADKETRILRVMSRDGMSREEALDRIERQMSDEEKRIYCDTVIENDGSYNELIEKVDEAYEKEFPRDDEE